MYTYLIIDDEHLIRKGTIKKLEPLKETVCCCGEAENGEEGIRLAEKLHPDIIIADMQMPVMGGMELLPYLASHFPDTILIVISGFQNFHYVKQAISSRAIEYILKPFSRENIQKIVLSAIDSLKNKKQMKDEIFMIQEEREHACYRLDVSLLQNLIMGYDLQSSQKILSQKLDFINHSGNFLLLTLYFYQKPSMEIHFEKWIAQNNYNDIAVFFPHPHIEQFCFILLFIPELQRAREEFIQSFLSRLMLMTEQYQYPLYAGISACHDNIRELHTAYRETAAALDSQRISRTDSHYYFCRDIGTPVSISWEKEEELLFRIESCATEQVYSLTDELFDYYREILDCTLGDVKRHCEHISFSCRKILDYYLNQKSPDEKSSPNMQAIVNTLYSLEDVKKYYLQFFINISNMIKSDSIYRNHDTIEQICIYLSKNYQKNLTQEFIASLFYLNRSYLSQLFKKKTGEKFVNYLNNIRIEKAKELLTQTDKDISSVARSVGYDNTKYFFRVFKKKVGTSPELYRQNVPSQN